jgi:hypothetical protein
MRTPEAKVKDKVCKYLDSRGVWYFRPYMAGYGKSGVPDLVCCFRGRFVSIEVKREGKEPTPRQDLRMKEIRASGGIAIWGDSTDCIISQLEMLR